jgi:predicted nucleic acid-binding protein
MISLFFDSNIWLRLFLQDDKEHYESVKKLISYTNDGFFRPYSSSIVFLEVNYVLRSFYKLSYEKTLLYLAKIKGTRNITIIDSTDINRALAYYQEYKIKFTDCLIASQIRKDITLVTFDLEFKKIKEIVSQTPKEVLFSFRKTN